MRFRLFDRPTLVAAAPLLIATLSLAACAPSGGPEGQATTGRRTAADLTPQVQGVLDAIRAADAGQLSTSPEDGRFLRMLIVTSGARRAVEIGGASGYGAIWMGLGMRETGGSLVTIEYDPERARQLQANITAAGLDDTVRVVAGDAFKALPELEGTFDLVFLDAWKPDYKRFFDMTFPRLDRGGLFIAHNVVNKRDEMLDFLTAVESHPDMLTSIVSPGLEGMSVSVKR